MIKGYLDNASTTETKFFAKDFYIPGNPNSPTAIGRKAHEELTKARERIKEHLGVKSGKVIIGGTASQLIEKVKSRTSCPWFGSAYEHDNVYKCLNVVYKKPEEITKNLQRYVTNVGPIEAPICITWMLTNNITGTIFDVKSIGELCHKYDAYYIMDCTASIGHNSIPEGVEDYCDCLITSSHKHHGPSGIGCMWVSDRFTSFLDLTDDDHDEYGLIPGTPDVGGAMAMSYAMKHMIDWERSIGSPKYMKLFEYLDESLERNQILRNYVDGESPYYTAAINAITLPGFNADALVQFLSSRGVYISAGHSACAEHDDFRVLEAFGLSKEEASQTVRISFCEDSSFTDVDMLVDGIVSFKKKFMD